MSLLAFLGLGLVSCSKEGCTDDNADNYDASADVNTGCVYRYFSSIEVQVPDAYDDLSAPDLYVQFSKNSSSTWDHSTTQVNNSVSATWSFTTDLVMTIELWDIVVMDDDDISSDEQIYRTSFNPLSETSNPILLTNGLSTIRIGYTIN